MRSLATHCETREDGVSYPESPEIAKKKEETTLGTVQSQDLPWDDSSWHSDPPPLPSGLTDSEADKSDFELGCDVLDEYTLQASHAE